MVFSQNRDDIRQHFYTVWKKYNDQKKLDPLEQLIANVIRLHPEYHILLATPDNIAKDFTPEMGETNPFLHMGMHIGLYEQLATQRPVGINKIYEKLLTIYEDKHTAEHKMMECLGESLWQAQRDNVMPDETKYLSCLKKLAGL